MLITPMIFFFFFNDTATTEIYTLSLHDALPICGLPEDGSVYFVHSYYVVPRDAGLVAADRKSTRLNSSHGYISYAVFCLKKKKQNTIQLSSSTTITANSGH